jgi:hypothetical protein
MLIIWERAFQDTVFSINRYVRLEEPGWEYEAYMSRSFKNEHLPTWLQILAVVKLLNSGAYVGIPDAQFCSDVLCNIA